MGYNGLWYIFATVWVLGITVFAIAVEHLLMWFLPWVEVGAQRLFWWLVAHAHYY